MESHQNYYVIITYTLDDSEEIRTDNIGPFRTLYLAHTYFDKCLECKRANEKVVDRNVESVRLVTISKVFCTSTVKKRSSDSRPHMNKVTVR